MNRKGLGPHLRHCPVLLALQEEEEEEEEVREVAHNWRRQIRRKNPCELLGWCCVGIGLHNIYVYSTSAFTELVFGKGYTFFKEYGAEFLAGYHDTDTEAKGIAAKRRLKRKLDRINRRKKEKALEAAAANTKIGDEDVDKDGKDDKDGSGYPCVGKHCGNAESNSDEEDL